MPIYGTPPMGLDIGTHEASLLLGFYKDKNLAISKQESKQNAFLNNMSPGG